ncbi:putative uncharacterized protein [Clostridium sp. CAG:768]|nr:putative uncharacterized protein [Clostridium sp. CAG:768]
MKIFIRRLSGKNKLLEPYKQWIFFISLHYDGFSNSVWCQQEVSYAVARGVKIIPLKFDGKENPGGFIGKYQGLSRLQKTVREVAEEIVIKI